MPIPVDNSQTDAKVKLGRQLYFDGRLSANNEISCATCHDPKTGWAGHDATDTGVGLIVMIAGSSCGVSPTASERAGASFTAYPIFPKFGQPASSFSACQTSGHSVSVTPSDCALPRSKQCAYSADEERADRFSSNSYAGQRSTVAQSRSIVIGSFGAIDKQHL
jgi:hypothetical protein